MGDDTLIQWISGDNGLFVHIAIFTMLFLGGMGFPIPEDLPIILGGIAAAKNIVDLRLVFLVCYIGVIIGDQIMFVVGYFFGEKILTAVTKSTFFPSLTEEKVQEVREGLRKRRLLYIFIARHLFPIRSVTFVAAGALRVPYLEFLIADGLAALVSVSLVLGLGFVLGVQLTPAAITHVLEEAHYYVIALLVLCLLIWRVKKLRNQASSKNELGKVEIINDKLAGNDSVLQ